jgi:hypothetical protein
MDAGRPPDAISPDQVAMLLNGTCRGGRLKPRPGWFNQPLSFASQGVGAVFQGDSTLGVNAGFFQEATFYTGGYQGPLASGGGNPCLLVSISGRQFRINLSPTVPTTATVADFTLPAIGGSVSFEVLTAFQMSLNYPDITIDGYPVQLIAINGNQITIQNQTAITTTTAQATLPGDGTTIVTVSVVSSAGFAQGDYVLIGGILANVAVAGVAGSLGLTSTVAATIPSGSTVIDGVPNNPLIPAGSTVAFPPLQTFPVDEITPVIGTLLGKILTAGTSPFTIPTVGAPASLPVTDASEFTLEYPTITLGGNTLTNPISTSAAPPFTVPPLNQSATMPVVSTAGMSMSLPDLGVAASTTTAAAVTFPTTGGPTNNGTGVSFPVSLASIAGISTQQPGLTLGGYPVQLLSLGPTTSSTDTGDYTIPATLNQSFAVGIDYDPTSNILGTEGMSILYPNITVNGYPLVLDSVDSPTQIHAHNTIAGNEGADLPPGSDVVFQTNLVNVQNNIGANAGVTVASGSTAAFNVPLLLTAINAEDFTIEVQNLLASAAGMTLAAGSGVYFQTTASTTATTQNTLKIPPNGIPAPGKTVYVAIPTAAMSPTLVGKNIVIGGYTFVLWNIDGSDQITVFNMTSANAGSNKHILPSSVAVFPKAGSTSISNTYGYAMPAVGSNISISLLVGTQNGVTYTGSQYMSLEEPDIYLGGYPVTLISIDSATQITVQNRSAENVGVWIPNGAPVSFTFPLYTLIFTGLIDNATIQVENNLVSQAGVQIPPGTNVTAQALDDNDPDVPLNWALQAERWWILQDGQALPIIFDGSSTNRSDLSKNQIPVGNVMCYCQGRLVVALTDRMSYMVGDAVFDPSGTPQYGFQDAMLYFTETLYLNEGGALTARIYGAPSNGGPILGMNACAQTNAQLGQGPLLVHTPSVVFTVNLPFDRTTWSTMTNPLQTANPINGAVGQRTITNDNTDCWYRSTDGIRSYKFAVAEFNGMPGNRTLSNEVDPILDYDTPSLLEWSSAVQFDNRRIETCSPVWSANGVWHRGLVVLDYNLDDGLRKHLGMVWEGVWSGLRVLKLIVAQVNGVERCFIFALNDSSQIELWELSTDQEYDGSWNGANLYPPTAITWTVQFRSMTCRAPDIYKRLKYLHLNAPVVSGSITGVVSYRADQWSCWEPWTTFTRCALTSDCGTWTGCMPTAYLAQPRTPIKLPEPPDCANEQTGKLHRLGYQHQVQLQVTGYAEISEIRLFALDEPEMVENDSETDWTVNPIPAGSVIGPDGGIVGPDGAIIVGP